MDDTQASIKSSSDAAAATRKRRSSILKSNRPPRTPFSELEFNVATPTDTSKSRRVSFSKRTGVAEFVTNEATTTWKNFYEEHNKSLESSGNDSAIKARGQMSIGHIGKRIFDQQFEEVDIVDIVGTLQPNTLTQEFHTSLNNLNLTQQLASLECYTDDIKLGASINQNLELSSFTEQQTKVFGDDLSIPVLPEMTNPIDINFSTLQPMSSKHKCDDLDEMIKDFKTPLQVKCTGAFDSVKDISEYNIDLNMTYIGIKNDDCEMSITDTIHNPEVQEVSKSISSVRSEQKLINDNDWTVDKENIIVNPYVTPKESKNFAINESSNRILVFDGKKLTVKSEKNIILESDVKKNFQNVENLPEISTHTLKRKTIVLNTDDDLPNFIPIENQPQALVGKEELSSSSNVSLLKQSIMYNESDLSITQAIDNKLELPKRKTIVFEDDMGNMSITQAIPAKVIINKEERRKTVIYEHNTADMSMTRAMPTNIIGLNKSNNVKRKSVVYEDDISFTQALPVNLIFNDKLKISQDRTMYYKDSADISFTQVIPENISLVKNKYSKRNLIDISITQGVPCNMIDAYDKSIDTARTIIFDNNGDIEMTQAVSDNVLLPIINNAEKLKTIVPESDSGHISITQAVPGNIVFDNVGINCDYNIESSNINDDTNFNKSNIQPMQIKAELSVNTQSDPTKQVFNKSKTIIYNDDAGDISITKVVPCNIIVPETKSVKMEISSDHDVKDISITSALPTTILPRQSRSHVTPSLMNVGKSIILPSLNTSVKYDNLTRSTNKHIVNQQESEIFESDILSLTTPVSNSILDIQRDNLSKRETLTDKSFHISQAKNLFTDNISIKQDILIYQTVGQNMSQSRDKDKNNYTTEEETESRVKTSNVSLNNKDNVTENHSDITVCKTFLDKTSSDNVDIYDIIEDKNSLDKQLLAQTNTVVATESTLKPKVPNDEQNLKIKKSFLIELLDMSNASLDDVVKDDTDVIQHQVIPNKLTDFEDVKSGIDTKSSESLFVVIADSEDDVQAEIVEDIKSVLKVEREINILNGPEQITKGSPAIEYKEESEDVQDLQIKIAVLKAANEDNKASANRHYEKIVSIDMEDGNEKDKFDVTPKSKSFNITKGKKSFKNADDTRELLGMLSDFTEGTDKCENDKSTASVEIKDNVTLKSNYEQKNLSFIPKRQSIILSREDLLHNISMAQAALRQSRYDIDESEIMEDTHDSFEETIEEDVRSHRKSVRMSTEVVKTLQFDEEDSISDASIQSDMKMTPLKKTAFGETTYMRENKAKVIPTYLKDVSDNMKALMSDLVKPMADVLPYDVVGIDKSLKKSPSTCSTQIQANIITSSQIDIDVELHSNIESANIIETSESNMDIPTITDKGAKDTLAHSLQSAPIAAMEIDHISIIETPNIKRPIPHSQINGPVIVFDHSNPLNNILIRPTDNIKVHKYNPIKSTDTLLSEHENSTQMEDKTNKDNNVEIERMSVQYNIENVICQQQSGLQSGDTCATNIKDCNSLISNVSKPLSIDRSTEGFLMEVKSVDVNTVIAMKVNKELLEASSSLTLVDDALAQSAFDINVNSAKSDETNRQTSPLRVIYQMESEGELLQKIDSDMTSNDDDFDEINDNSNSRKRSYSPKPVNNIINKSNSNTPKPVKKMQKMSNSPKQKQIDLDKLLLNSDKMDPPTDISRRQKSPKKSSPKCTEVTIQHVTTEHARTKAEDKTYQLNPVEPRSSSENCETSSVEVRSMGVVSSFTSSNDARDTQDDIVSDAIAAVASDASSVNWQPELVDQGISKNLSECSSSVNVVDRINMLKFMGRECEWEASSGDVWSFRLLRARVRLTARLAHTHRNAPRSCARADTPLEGLTVNQIRKEVKDPLAAVCVRFATEAMRYECSSDRGYSRASDVVALLKRCAAIARVALLWVRAMRDARLRLAYSITPEGEITLKVANIPLRSVWEVKMRVELVVGDAREAAWPRAGHLRVCAVLADTAPAPDLARLLGPLPADWRHAPAAVWTVFRYLKGKTRDDSYLGL